MKSEVFTENNIVKLLAPNYFIIFEQKETNFDYLPIEFESLDKIKSKLASTKLMFDEELDSTLDIIMKLLHFPRINYDTSELTPNQISKINNSSQSIIPIPLEIFKELYISNGYKNDRDYFILCEGINCEEAFRESIKNIYSFEEFNSLKLKTVWEDICDYDNGMKEVVGYFNESNLELLPLVHFSDYLGKVDADIFKLNSKAIYDLANYRWKQQAFLDSYKLLGQLVGEIDEKKKQEIKDDALFKAMFPITIAAPGQAVIVDKITSDNGIPENELKALKLIGIHNAIENNGLYLSIKKIERQCFIELEKLEAYSKDTRRKGDNNRYIWRTLRKIGSLITEKFTDNEIDIIRRASHINTFSNFPLGLAIFPNATAPLCCYKSLSYKPITPLTRTLQIQFPKKREIFVSKNSKILIVECIEEEDRIRKASDKMWDFFRQSINKSHFNVVYEVVRDVKEFNDAIKKHPDTLFLIISAHGFEDHESNYSGIKIGKNDYWSPIDNDFRSPPIVFFSACHTGSRGKGIISISDLFIRSGAYTVLSTLVPVDVYKNGLLMIRFFIYISESMDGKNDFGNLSEVWKHVVSTNAVNEVLESSLKLKDWAMRKRKDGTWPLSDFQLIEAPKKLDIFNVYDRTIAILREIAEREGVLNKFDKVLKVDNCYPESLFYQLIGYPEHVFINSLVLEFDEKLLKNE
ncbi:CHAT domain-containing protein [Lysinibacillus xylanilyticus]|uniref:CHAT domain-containing protein n=1 Tax=Lysinibacillus xylanilyticus TaxID=582475 RepID=UPI003D00555A